MNGAQDLGGMMGFGPIDPEADEPVFHHDWERYAMGLTLAMHGAGQWNLDMSRHARETLPPAVYLTKSYYDIWISALEKLIVQSGLVSAAELAGGRVIDPPKPGVRRFTMESVDRLLTTGAPYDRPAPGGPLFAAGEAVRTRVMHPTTHTRLPRYARGKLGTIEAVRGCFVYPDANAHGRGEDPRWCYTVVFTGTELWGPDADPRLTVSIDAWEPYLERA